MAEESIAREDPIQDLHLHIMEVDPELFNEFMLDYKDPTFRANICNRCGALVHVKRDHLNWHKNLSLSIFVIGSTCRFLIQRVRSHEPSSDD